MSTLRRETRLTRQAHIGDSGKAWHLDVLGDLESRLTDPGFPCVFSKNAFRKKIIEFVFVENGGRTGVRHLGEGIEEYVGLSREWDGRLDTAAPLVAAFSLKAVEADSVEEYHAFGWRILQELHEIDPAPWPGAVGKDPDSDSWSMCFNGMPLFCNMSSPAHRIRRSRNLGGHFVIVINPRERFDVFAGDTPSGRKVRSNIRERIGRYDGAPHSPQLGSYGSGALEWRQYGLTEGDAEKAGRCPFVFREPLN
ncbi:YqcI/YcgG family protein [Actinorugispora endophytica]|uniref:N-omega-hydroxy-L-arginine synthase n=1 Tax=Actinorugispora endophytica TaxID=1605990 RepID=A0A4V3D8W1_9ACTN|nr:YqcI/YcgG family protein [Actinorugispora endophytica]TDQ53239.1 N-omega-hydroxy-L-arginine synthase [Actinorugispora endophytica]